MLCTNAEFGALWDKLLDKHPNFSWDNTADPLTRRQRIFGLVFWWDAELQNGGILQFLDNTSGDNYHQTIDALLAIGSFRSALWMTYIQDEFGVTFDTHRGRRSRQLDGLNMETFEERVEKAHERVRRELGDWEPDETENKLLRFIRQNPLFP